MRLRNFCVKILLMISTYVLVTLLALLIGYFVGLPISKKRPVFIRERGCAVLLSVLVALGAVFSDWIYLAAIAVGLLTYLAKPWVIHGISREQINSAIERASQATRTSFLSVNFGYKLDDNKVVKISNLGGRLHVVRFKNLSGSKKARLTKNVTRKFIQNYFTST